MLDDYNKGGFNTGYVTISDKDESEYELEPDDSGYDQTKLLYPTYTVFDIGTLNLAAPASCQSFKWVVTDLDSDDTEEPIAVTYYNEDYPKDSQTTKDFVVHIPDSGLESPHTYVLTLTVVGKKGGVYKDAAQLFIVKFNYGVTND